jgi:hypothetical protein
MAGMSKHRKSGKAPKSPKMKMAMKLDAERSSRKPKHFNCKHKSVTELMGSK